MINLKLSFFDELEEIDFFLFEIYENFNEKQITNFINKNLKILKQGKDVSVIFLVKNIIKQKNFNKLSKTLQKEILNIYLDKIKPLSDLYFENVIDYKTLLEFFNIFYNLSEEFIEEELEVFVNEIMENIQKTKIINYSIYYEIEKFINLYKFYNKNYLLNENFIDFIKNNVEIIYYFDLNYIDIFLVIETIEELIFTNEENNENLKYISLLLLLINNNMEKIEYLLINDIEKYDEFINNIYNNIIIEILYEFENVPEILIYPIIKILEKIKINISNIEKEEKDMLIKFVFKYFKRENFENLSEYFLEYIYDFYKKKYKKDFEKKFFELITKNNLFSTFLKSKILFEENKLLKKFLKYYKNKDYLLNINIIEEYLKNPYFDLKNQDKLFQIMKEKERKLFLENNQNIDLIFLQKIIKNEQYFKYFLNNKQMIKNLIFNRI